MLLCGCLLLCCDALQMLFHSTCMCIITETVHHRNIHFIIAATVSDVSFVTGI